MKQDTYQLSANQNYPLGFKYPIKRPGDLREFYYGQAGGTLDTGFGAKSVVPQIIAIAALHAPANVLAVHVEIEVAGTDGANHDGVILENELAGGYVVIFTDTMRTINRMILANTATGGGITHTTITIDKPLPLPLVILNFHAECMANPYAGVQTGNFPKASVVGMPTMPATLALPFLWLQTWGPVWVTPSNLEGGILNDNQEVVFRGNGAIAPCKYDEPLYSARAQHAGFVLPNLRTGAQGAPFVFLEITP